MGKVMKLSDEQFQSIIDNLNIAQNPIEQKNVVAVENLEIDLSFRKSDISNIKELMEELKLVQTKEKIKKFKLDLW